MKSINECIQWIEMLKKRKPNVEDLNYFNSIEKYLIELEEKKKQGGKRQ